MGRNTSGGPFYATALGQTHHNKVATPGNGNYLVEVRCQGNIMLAYSALGIATGNNPTYNLVAGLQYGATGYTVADVTNGQPGASNWMVWSAGLPPSAENNDVAGTSPTNVMERVSYALDLTWKGLWYFPSGGDVYLVIGMDQGQPVHSSFGAFYNHWAVWVS